MNDPNPYAPPSAPVEDRPASEEELASLGARFGGALIDSVLMTLISIPYFIWSDYWGRATAGLLGFSDLLSLLLVNLVVFLALNGYLLHKHGQTIGKRFVGTRIVSAADGQLVPLGKVFGLRYVPIQFMALLPGVGNFIPLLDVLFIFREDRRCLHDLIAGTKVVKAR